jgi:hypothetical protein
MLVARGVPPDLAFSLEPAERIAWLVTLAELGGEFRPGGRWDWAEQRLAAR